VDLIRSIRLALIGGIIFSVVFALHYSFIDSNLYQARDDGVITMSVGRHLVDFGFIGVSPSGPIVEASSSPLQTFVYAVSYYLTEVDYKNYSVFQTAVSTFLIGAIFISFFKDRPNLAPAITFTAATALSFQYSFSLWHASGMENALTHVLFLVSVFLLFDMVSKHRINYFWALPIFLASIARIDSVVHVAPLLVFFSVYWLVCEKRAGGFYLSVLVGLLWLAFQSGRLVYFGDLLPNTAYAQNISVSGRMGRILNGDIALAISSFTIASNIFVLQGWWISLLGFPFLIIAKLNRAEKFVLLAIATLFISACLTPVLFGPARIDPTRITTHVTLLLILWLAIVLTSNSLTRSPAHIFRVLLLIGSFGVAAIARPPYYLGWSTQGFDETRLRFAKLAEAHNIDRPLVSNPDLGAMTWHKQFNVFDLGALGSPVVAKLSETKLISNYLLEFARPDFIESHGYWTKRYCADLFLDKRFSQLYTPANAEIAILQMCQSQNPETVIWVRKGIERDSDSLERQLLDDLQNNLDTTRIRTELEICALNNGDCRYVVRTIYRFIPELRKSQRLVEVIAFLDSDLAQAYLLGWQDTLNHLMILREFE